MDLAGRAKRVRVYVNETDKVGHLPASMAILQLLRREDALGATVLRGLAGFGSTGQIHSYHLVDVAQHLPEVVEWIDAPEVVERLLPRVKELVPRGLVTIDDTEIVLHRPNALRELPRSLTAADVMSREISSAARATPLQDVVELMLGKVYRSVPVLEDGVPVGIITNGDLVRRGGLGVRVDLLRALEKPELHDALRRLAATGKAAEDVMTPAPATVHVTTPVRRVAQAMSSRRLKRLPVVDDRGALVGMVSRVDLLRTAARAHVERKEPAARELGLAGDPPIAAVMRRDVPTVHPETPLSEVFQAVISTRLHRALVVDAERRVLGMVTDAELLDRITPSLRPGALRSLVHRLPFARPAQGDAPAEQHARARTAAELMDHAVPSVREDALLSHAIAVMLEGGHKLLAVVDEDGRLAGIVDRADLLHALASSE
jgi:CBS-domain-containing membrane protein